MVALEVRFREYKEDDKPEALRMEHFYFPLGLWLVGMLLSFLCFIMEIIIHRLRKSKTDVPIASLEEPSVTQSTPESEDRHNSDVEDIEDNKI